jgi:F-type H+-transporting ATPase subunit delta
MTARVDVAEHLVANLTKDRQAAVQRAAAWLVATGRTRQAGYLARDVASALAIDGYLLVRLTTARPLAAVSRQRIEAYLKATTGATTLELAETVDPAVIGGIRIETPDAVLDDTVKSKLAKLVEGASR